MIPPAEQLKSCCAAVYESDFARMLLGDSFHPGGLELTARLGEYLQLRPGMRVLDVASGKGESVVFLADRFGCKVTGVDYSAANVAVADERNQNSLVSFAVGDAERLEFMDGSFDAVICECAFCTFPDKMAAAGEFARILRRPGQVGMTDMTRVGALPPGLEGLLAWIACIGDARPLSQYAELLGAAGFSIGRLEAYDQALAQFVRDIQGRLMGIEIAMNLKKIDLGGVDLTEAKQMARTAAEAIRKGLLGYGLLTATCS